MMECMKYSDIIFGNKEDALSSAKYLYEELGLEKDTKSLKDIAMAIAKFEKVNKNRQRVMIITDSGNPVTIAVNGLE